MALSARQQSKVIKMLGPFCVFVNIGQKRSENDDETTDTKSMQNHFLHRHGRHNRHKLDARTF